MQYDILKEQGTTPLFDVSESISFLYKSPFKLKVGGMS